MAAFLRKFWRSEVDESPAEAHSRSLRASLLREQRLDELLGAEPAPPPSPRGLYIFGSVGSGKTMLMDRFYERLKLEAAVPFRRRVHFNAALLEVHHRMHGHDRSAKQALLQALEGSPGRDLEAERQKQAKLAKLAVRRHIRRRLRLTDEQMVDSLAKSNAAVFGDVASALIRGGDKPPNSLAADGSEEEMTPGVLCFDEVNVNDPFTALALKGVFEALIDSGTVIVATSNRAPWDLNHFGVHEAIFDHFKRRLRDACTPLDVSCQDFRRLSPTGALGGAYLHPLDANSGARFEALWAQALESEANPIQEQTIDVMFGRSLQVTCAAGGLARFDFRELCDAPKGAGDYYALAQRFHTVFIDGIPVMSQQKRNLARRFIVLLDELYNARVKLVCTAAAAPEELFAATADDHPVFDAEQFEQLQFEAAAEGTRLRQNVLAEGGVAPVLSSGTASVTSTHLGGLEEKFAFARAISRLYEMSRHVHH